MVLDYLSQNETLSYPFKDKCSLKATNNFKLPNGVFADAFIVARRADITGAYLKSIEYTAGDILITVAAVSDNIFTVVSELVCTIADVDITPHMMIYAESADFSLKIVLGTDFDSLITSAPLAFLGANAQFCVGAVVPYVPQVLSVTFNNLSEELTVIDGTALGEIVLTLEEGSNIALTEENEKLILSVSPGFGTGLYDGCGDDLVIKTVNYIGSDRQSNFLLQTDGCYNTEKLENGILLSNVCTPKCTATQLSAFAHYLNRVRDGMATMVTFATSVQEDIADAIADFNADLSRTAPVIKAAVTKFDNPYGAAYYSFVVSFFNKSDAEITVTTTITGATVLQSNSIRFKQGSRSVITYTDVDIIETVPCHEQGRLEFTIQASPLDEVTIVATAGDTDYSKLFTLT